MSVSKWTLKKNKNTSEKETNKFRKKMKKLLFISVLLMLFGVTNAQVSKQQVSGVYQCYQNDEPWKNGSLNFYFVLNKQGVALASWGYSSGDAFSDAANGISSGRILTGNFTILGKKINIKWKNGKPKTYVFDASDNSLRSNDLQLIFVKSL